MDWSYQGAKTKEISFPLGGIGTGCIGLAGNGRLIDWEIFNRPNKGSANGFSSFAVKAEDENGLIDARFLQGDFQPPYMGQVIRKSDYAGYGFGPDRSTLAGMPHFENCEFIGRFPFAQLRFEQSTFPLRLSLTAFNPFIPTNEDDSSMPAAFFEIEAENLQSRAIRFTAAFNLAMPVPGFADLPQEKSFCRTKQVGGRHAIQQGNHAEIGHVGYGDMTILTDAAEVSLQHQWYRGSWFDNLKIFWQDFCRTGPLNDRHYEQGQNGDTATLAAHLELQPGERKKVRFILAWNYPNCENYWKPYDPAGDTRCKDGCCCEETRGKTLEKGWKNHYATRFVDSLESARYAMSEYERLYRDTRLFEETLFASAMPKSAVEAVSANISILKSPTCLRLEDGSFYGWEGNNCVCGCCEGSCTHVWNYAYALPFLFPRLERSMRDLDYRYNLRAGGGMHFRLMLPLGRCDWGMRPCVDGQFGGVMKTYRDWKISGDTEWLKKHWPTVKQNIAYAWSDENHDRWDPDKTGVIWGRQHHTLDMELFGPNAWLTGFYLGALKAGAEMADFFGEPETAAEYRAIFKRGRKWVGENLFNGEYFIQRCDIDDKSVLQPYAERDPKVFEAYWNEEAGEIKYQIGEGCSIDQVLGEWHCNLMGLGEIFDKSQLQSALRSIYKYNYKKSMRDFANVCRLYTLNDEAGTVICAYPDHVKAPGVSLPYNDETMYGFEYQVAIHMLMEGMQGEGEELINAIRTRFDGERRNPWNEYECGSNYARSMASYALLNVYSGFEYDMVARRMGFHPKNEGSFFWSLDSGWGRVSFCGNTVELSVLYGSLTLRAFGIGPKKPLKALLGNQEIAFAASEKELRFDTEVVLKSGDTLRVVCG